jgi:rhodanese-related sulfurtransferase
MNRIEISRTSTMQEILEAFPGAQDALFRRYHVGGCGNCGFEPTQTLEEVCKKHNILGVEEVVTYLGDCHANEGRMEITVQELAAKRKSTPDLRLLDVRSPQENSHARIPGGTLVDEKLAREVLGWPQDTPIVLYCHLGERSLDAAMNLVSRGFTNVQSLAGGIDAWSIEIDHSLPRYQTSADCSTHK